jgi:hypothetical protein
MTSTSDRLRWIADYLGLAGKAVSVVACVRGIDYSQDIHRDAQKDLRALAELLDECPPPPPCSPPPRQPPEL